MSGVLLSKHTILQSRLLYKVMTVLISERHRHTFLGLKIKTSIKTVCTDVIVYRECFCY